MSLNPHLRDWKGRRAWLIGASSGIGLSTAAALHARGANVIVSARNAESLTEFTTSHAGAVALQLDVTQPGDVERVAADVVQQGPLDLVLFCAGHYREQRATEYDLAEMVRHQQVNYVGALHVLGAVLPALLRQGHGHLSLVASVAGYRGLPRSLAYGPTKAALINLAESLYIDLAPRGIGVSVICPGFVATPLTANNAFAMPALMGPDDAATEILAGWARGQFEIHFPKRFTYVMKMLSLLPFGVYQAAVRRLTGL